MLCHADRHADCGLAQALAMLAALVIVVPMVSPKPTVRPALNRGQVGWASTPGVGIVLRCRLAVVRPQAPAFPDIIFSAIDDVTFGVHVFAAPGCAVRRLPW
jgi:hypothetical protein